MSINFHFFFQFFSVFALPREIFPGGVDERHSLVGAISNTQWLIPMLQRSSPLSWGGHPPKSSGKMTRKKYRKHGNSWASSKTKHTHTQHARAMSRSGFVACYSRVEKGPLRPLVLFILGGVWLDVGLAAGLQVDGRRGNQALRGDVVVGRGRRGGESGRRSSGEHPRSALVDQGHLGSKQEVTIKQKRNTAVVI